MGYLCIDVLLISEVCCSRIRGCRGGSCLGTGCGGLCTGVGSRGFVGGWISCLFCKIAIMRFSLFLSIDP